jgi:ABC-type uncharacterized transport system YnjBCD ATPase subunit
MDMLDTRLSTVEQLMKSNPDETGEKIRSHLGSFGISGNLALRPMYLLSGGQKSRVACLRAILSEPDALLLDEPFSSIDPEQRNSFRLFVANQVREKKIPCILVTHDESDKLISDYSPLDLNKFSS